MVRGLPILAVEGSLLTTDHHTAGVVDALARAATDGNTAGVAARAGTRDVVVEQCVSHLHICHCHLGAKISLFHICMRFD